MDLFKEVLSKSKKVYEENLAKIDSQNRSSELRIEWI